MAIVVEGPTSIHVSSAAHLVEDGREVAWAEQHVVRNPDVKWILGNYVEADNANDNGHIFPLKDLKAAQASIAHKPLNMLHRPHQILGAFVASEMMYPQVAAAQVTAGLTTAPGFVSTTYNNNTAYAYRIVANASDPPNMNPKVGDEDAANRAKCATCGTVYDPDNHRGKCPSCGGTEKLDVSLFPGANPGDANTSAYAAAYTANPQVEALSVFWKYYFPDVYAEIEAAHGQGQLFYSMECVPETVGCIEAACKGVFAYAGRNDPSYCDHLNAAGARKMLNKPHFTAGALILPPVRPGWKRADIKEVSNLIKAHVEAEQIYSQISHEAPHMSPVEWEALMVCVLASAEAT